MQHIIPTINFRDPDYLTNLFLEAIQDEKRSGEKFAAYCEGAFKKKLSVESISFLLVSSGKFKSEPAARKNAHKILLLGGSIINLPILKDLREGKISFERALWSVKDPKPIKMAIAQERKLKKVKVKTKVEVRNDASSLVVKGLHIYWKAESRELESTMKWLTKIVEYHISRIGY